MNGASDYHSDCDTPGTPGTTRSSAGKHRMRSRGYPPPRSPSASCLPWLREFQAAHPATSSVGSQIDKVVSGKGTSTGTSSALPHPERVGRSLAWHPRAGRTCHSDDSELRETRPPPAAPWRYRPQSLSFSHPFSPKVLRPPPTNRLVCSIEPIHHPRVRNWP